MTTEAAQTQAEPKAASHVVTREELDQVTANRHGFYTLPNGSRILFSSLRRSILYAIDADLFNDAGEVDNQKFRERPARIMATVLCDGQGNRLYKDEEWEKVDSLKPSIFEPLWKAIRKHLDLDKEAENSGNPDPNG
ncbi:hypothetical protein [Allorhodopirellula heiligendammensis]|uniref:Uncharacterized protein n=1 Tax=Allorhodopirellula heiligendammensis TaxID=2714739 RepID=A0A5C6C624_9BACT|nr:hypothetical protein [Allorhodopirellula heiligendammensis]TWU19565.1 hypothetical protein Poly21_17390 [Allorhodopirellula heiligendammensis]